VGWGGSAKVRDRLGSCGARAHYQRWSLCGIYFYKRKAHLSFSQGVEDPTFSSCLASAEHSDGSDSYHPIPLLAGQVLTKQGCQPWPSEMAFTPHSGGHSEGKVLASGVSRPVRSSWGPGTSLLGIYL
jgi:hypothetical protein